MKIRLWLVYHLIKDKVKDTEICSFNGSIIYKYILWDMEIIVLEQKLIVHHIVSYVYYAIKILVVSFITCVNA